MKSNIFIPKLINVGYQTRSDTYTKKLAYVIYYDEKGKLRKEASWNSWRDDKIEPQEFTNEPTSGFVLNKKVGDYSSGWEHRKSYVRIYDPRNFEFEITIENLLYILENTSAIKGKGLEGEFIYGWDGKDLILIPTESPDYTSITEYNDIVHNNQTIKAKDLIIGATYLTKDNKELVYVGKFDYYSYGYRWMENGEYKYSKSCSDIPYTDNGRWGSSRVNHDNIDFVYGKYFWFAEKYYNYNYVDGEKVYDSEYTWSLSQSSGVTNKFIKCVDDKCTEYYSDIFEKLEGCHNYSPVDESKNIITPYNLEEFLGLEQSIKDRWYGVKFYDANGIAYEIRFNKTNETFFERINQNNGWSTRYNDIPCTLEEFLNKIKPVHLDKYLTNGRFYERNY